jgi:hypothetical protein
MNHSGTVGQRHTASMFIEQRIENRESVALPLRLGDGINAVTRDISPSGMYLEIRGDAEIGTKLFFEMDLADARMKFTAEGHVVRLEHRDGFTGIAVKLVSPRLEPLL